MGSWSLYLQNVNPDEVDDALDGSEPSGDIDSSQYDAAKNAANLLAERVDDAGAALSLSISGHRHNADVDGDAYDQINVSLIANTPASPVVERGPAPAESPAPPAPEPTEPQPSDLGQTPAVTGGAEAVTPPDDQVPAPAPEGVTGQTPASEEEAASDDDEASAPA